MQDLLVSLSIMSYRNHKIYRQTNFFFANEKRATRILDVWERVCHSIGIPKRVIYRPNKMWIWKEEKKNGRLYSNVCHFENRKSASPMAFFTIEFMRSIRNISVGDIWIPFLPPNKWPMISILLSMRTRFDGPLAIAFYTMRSAIFDRFSLSFICFSDFLFHRPVAMKCPH